MKKPQSFKTAVASKLTKEELKLLKRSQDTIGNIAIIEVPKELSKKAKLLGETLLETKPYIHTVLQKGKHTGEFRTQKLKWLAGEKTRETIHVESKTKLKLNVETVYFSPRLSTERERIAKQVKKGENILVMFSGCAPFVCVIAKNSKAKNIIGVEVNPTAHLYAVKNLKLNKLNNCGVLVGDVGKIVPLLEEEFDRIVMPAPHNASEFLDVAFKKIKKNGIIHYYDFAEDASELKKIIRESAEKNKKKIRILRVVKCGQVSPNEFRMCIDFKVL